MAIIANELLAAAVLITSSASGGTEGSAGTGFVYGRGIQKNDDGTITASELAVVTCAHVVEAAQRNSHDGAFWVWWNRKKGMKVRARYEMGAWVIHPARIAGSTAREHDIAIGTVAITKETQNPRDFDWFLVGEDEAWTKEKLTKAQIWEGNEVLTWGYPQGIGIREHKRSWPYMRGGIISQIRPWYEGEAGTFVIDVDTYGGQSGSPVVLRPHIESLEGHEAVTSPKIIGMVCARTLAPAVIGTRRRIPNETNTETQEEEEVTLETMGLGEVVPMDAINEAFDYAVEKAKAEIGE